MDLQVVTNLVGEAKLLAEASASSELGGSRGESRSSGLGAERALHRVWYVKRKKKKGI